MTIGINNRHPCPRSAASRCIECGALVPATLDDGHLKAAAAGDRICGQDDSRSWLEGVTILSKQNTQKLTQNEEILKQSR